ncbi:M14 family zinc carboxypeptidase [Streptacidiphilus sp. PAMC 29251]
MSRSARMLAAAHPDRCRLRRIGTSREGRPLELLSVGRPGGPDGPDGRNVLVVAVPHANEPLGGATVLALAEHALAELTRPARANALTTPTTWNFLLCLDPDGALRHETGPRQRRSLYDHHRHFFRPVTDEQPEWAPSLRSPGEALPETRALAELIDELRPFLQFSLHGADVDGSWIQLTRDIPGLAAPFAASAADLGIPVAVGTCDAMYWPSPGPGIYVMPPPGVPESFASQSETAADSTWYYPHLYGGVTAIVEVPMWGSPLMSDQSLHPAAWTALHGSANALRRSGVQLARLLERGRPYFSPAAVGEKGEGPLLRAAERAVQVCPGLADDWDPALRHPGVPPTLLTCARVSSLDALAHRIPLRATAMLLQLLDGATDPRAIRLHAELDAMLLLRSIAYVNELRAAWIPIARQVAHQARTALATYHCLLAQEQGRQPRQEQVRGRGREPGQAQALPPQALGPRPEVVAVPGPSVAPILGAVPGVGATPSLSPSLSAAPALAPRRA